MRSGGVTALASIRSLKVSHLMAVALQIRMGGRRKRVLYK